MSHQENVTEDKLNEKLIILQKQMDENQEEIQMLRKAENTMFNGLKKLEDEIRENVKESRTFMDTQAQKIENEFSTLQAKQEVENSKAHLRTAELLEKLREELYSNSQEILNLVHNVEVAQLSKHAVAEICLEVVQTENVSLKQAFEKEIEILSKFCQ